MLIGILGIVAAAGVAVPSSASESTREEAPTDPGRWLTEVDLGNPNGLPSDIVATRDGTVWVSVFGDRSVERLDRTGAVIATYALSGAPSSVAVDDEGGVWAAVIASNMIAHISAAGVVREYPLPTANSLPAHVWDAGGQAYFTASGTGKLGRLSESTGAVEEWVIPGAVQLGELDGLGEQVWVVDEGAGAVWMIDRAGAVPSRWDIKDIRKIDLESMEGGRAHGTVQTTTGVVRFDYPTFTHFDAGGEDLRGFARIGDRTWAVSGSTTTLYGTSPGSRLTYSLPPSAQVSALAFSESRVLWMADRKRGKVIRFDTLAAVQTSRVGGADRYEVSANVARRFDDPNADTVFLASGEKFADALSVGPMASRLRAPVLLSTKSSLSDSVLRELIRADPKRVVIVGGRASISDEVVAVIRRELPSSTFIDRIEGADRYEVSRALLTGVDAPTDPAALYIANGSTFPDALSSTPAAAGAKTGVLLVKGSSAKLSQAEMTLVWRFATAGATIKIAGGPASVSTGIEAQIAEFAKVVRFDGPDRYAVSLALNREAFPSSNQAFIASGTTFADALSGGAIAGRLNAPLYLSRRECMPPEVLERLATGVRETFLLGGENTLTPAVLDLTACG
ncbi:cell wall-binding repeat-containing protein [Herbiconiux sp. CPCC 203407]|uniref:Cell wall-binding repeat-containing protein n=1 Tax=Herbiconiux oxytropis TaxID=2970915 RepID=A0AA41XBL7_9MICO|nr:cell wall-binding repeat-containing protein [Herbiconiux oxytropis]MCS5722967.1 cell wall-binding repeat-containing protein [Herbiconiux oxytropis]MCS5725221.1 cell wall-binding repeat-containing protein [Herbiconiux oxytropis]